MAIIDIPTGNLPYEVVDKLPKQGEENKIYGVLIDETVGIATDYRWHNGAWEEVDLGANIFSFLFADYQKSVQETVTEMQSIIEEQSAKIVELEEAVFSKEKTTVLYEDGVLIINETVEDRSKNTELHGGVIAEYPPLNEQNSYVFTSRKDRPWNNERDDIYAVKFGSLTEPTSIAYWFQDCTNLQEVDWVNFKGDVNKSCRACFAKTNLEYLDLPYMPELETIRYMCQSCEQLKEVHFLNTMARSLINTIDAFQGCYALTEISLIGLAGSVDMCERTFANVESHGRDMNLQRIYSDGKLTFLQASNSTDMFRGCTSLIGGNGTSYMPDATNNIYARIDAPDEPGYFTEWGGEK